MTELITNIVGDTEIERSRCPLTGKDCYGDCMWAITNPTTDVRVCAISVIALNIADK